MDNTTDQTDSIPLIGEEFPTIEAETTHGTVKLPDDYEGEWFVIFSHPGDFTPVCTTEFAAFEQRREEFEERNAKLIGLSVDRVHSHHKWTEWIESELDIDIQFPIIADESGQVGEQLGMIQPNAGTSTVRAVFVVDPEGTVRQLLYYPEEIGRNIDEILRSLDALQTSDREGVATPADWPENDTFDDRVLLPPPDTAEEIDARRAEAESDDLDQRDWWFTLKEL
jgi:peroxiredoxin (alkyl hydroperoxide reductase subunit C)